MKILTFTLPTLLLMTPSQFLDSLESPKKELLTRIHKQILKTNKQVSPEVSGMMGKEMLVYKLGGFMLYALSNMKSHMSLHLIPMYGCAPIHAKYSKLLNKAKFQKGCINFKKQEDMSEEVVENLLKECSKVDMQALLEKYKRK
jgi:hypothetical protein